MKKLLLLLGLLAGTAHAHDEYYTLTSTLASAACQNGGDSYNGDEWVAVPCAGPVTVSGWFETDGFGKSCEGSAACPVPDYPGWRPLVTSLDLTFSYNGLTTSLSEIDEVGTGTPTIGLVATSKGLFCDKCSFNDTWASQNDPFFNIGGGQAKGQNGFVNYLLPFSSPTTNIIYAQFATAPVGSGNFMIAKYAGTSMPTAAPELDPGHALASLMLLAGIGLVLQGRRR